LVLVEPLCRARCCCIPSGATSLSSFVDAKLLLSFVAALDSVDDPVPVLISLPGSRGMQLVR